MNKKKVLYYLILIAVCSIDLAMAAETGGKNTAQQYFRNLIMTDTFKTSMDLGFLIYAALKWYTYFNNFNPATAFIDIVIPAFITFVAFNWVTFLQFVQILPGAAK